MIERFKRLIVGTWDCSVAVSITNTRSAAVRVVSSRLVALILILLLGAGVAQGTKDKRKAPPPPPFELPGHVSYLARQLYGVPLDESGPITSQIQKLGVDRLVDWMSKTQPISAPGDTPLDVRVRRELESAFSKLHYPLFGQPAVFTETWKGKSLVLAGYTLGWTDYDRVNVLALFEGDEGKFHLAAVTNFVPHTDLHYEMLRAPQTDDCGFFLYGTSLGTAHLTLSA